MFKENLLYLVSGLIVLVLFSCQKSPSAPPKLPGKPSTQLELILVSEVPTEIDITVDSANRKIPPKGQVVFYYVTNPNIVLVEGSTAFKAPSGKIIGETVNWKFSFNLSGSKRQFLDLFYDKDICFIAIKNLSQRKIGSIEVRSGSRRRNADLLIPADGKRYHVGYFQAYPGMQIKAHYLDKPSEFCRWKEGIDFRLSWRKNQVAVLTIPAVPSPSVPGEVHHQENSIKDFRAGLGMPQQVMLAEFPGDDSTYLNDLKIGRIFNSE